MALTVSCVPYPLDCGTEIEGCGVTGAEGEWEWPQLDFKVCPPPSPLLQLQSDFSAQPLNRLQKTMPKLIVGLLSRKHVKSLHLLTSSPDIRTRDVIVFPQVF